ncbi:DUF1194 domain-containing protein [Aminobacter sp. HY435]|uniref:DUF1194 domain-containing protein n=1 Tax=Aminobacter sp. HY435 TaxID=2970917 RepID=UPI0022B9B6DF|nr:DUF1194 domain-containing protein [Aminobacter sp. HY435]
MLILAALVCCPSQARADEVDTAIVFAVDVSGSVDPATAYLQREGHAAALSSQAVLSAIARTLTGCIAVTYVEWSSYGQMRTVVPWTNICGAEDANIVASAIRNEGDKGLGCESMCRTSISFAIDLSIRLLNTYNGNPANKIIDISANGTNNDGLPVADSRSRAIKAGFTINAIAVPESMPGVRIDLAQYFADNVIGGPNSFVMPLSTTSLYASALRLKIVREISETTPNHEVGSASTGASLLE